MKKFLTFFAMLCALLGFSPHALADPANLYFFNGSSTTMNKSGSTFTTQVDATSSDVYGYITYSNTSDSWDTAKGAGQALVPDGHTSTMGDYTATNLNNTKLITWGSAWSNSYHFVKGKKYNLKVEFKSNVPYATVTEASSSKPPYIFIDGSSVAFSKEGSNWVYTVDAATSNKGFRIQNDVNDAPLGTTVSAMTFLGTDDGFEINATGTKTLKLWGDTDKYYTAKSGATYKLSIPTSANLTAYDNPFVMTITRTAAGPVKPATPVLPSAATSNKVAIPSVSGATVYCTISANDPGSPSTSWIKYTGAIDLNAANVTIWTAALGDGTDGIWSDVAHKSYTFGMPVPTVTIANDGTVTISVSSTVSDGKLMYGFSNSAINQPYTASFKASEGQTIYAQYTSIIFGNSEVASATYAGARTVTKIELFDREALKVSNPTPKGTATAPDADGVYKLGTVYVAGDNSYWNSTYSVKVTYNDGSKWYSTTATNAMSTIQPNRWRNTYERATWPVDGNCGFYVEDSKGKNMTVYVKFDGDDMQVKADVPDNSLTFGSSVPQIAGYGVGVSDGYWNESVMKPFVKMSDSPMRYEYEFEATDANAYFMLKINGQWYKPANGELSLETGSTRAFTAADLKSDNQCKLTGLTSTTSYVLTLTETSLGMQLSITEAGIPKPVLKRDAKENVVTINVPAGCTLHYTIDGGEERTATSAVTLTIPTNGMTVSAYFTKEGETGNGDTVSKQFTYYNAPQRWATKEWTLSDDGIMPRNSVKYFYMSRFQNDDRVSPEWELVKNGDTYTLDWFMVIPAGEFRLRRIAKDANGILTRHDYGLNSSVNVRPSDFGATSATVGTAEKGNVLSTTKTISKDKSRGYAWDMGFSMGSVSVTDTNAPTSDPDQINVTMRVDFNMPSTANVAPKPGIPYIALTGSKLQIPTIEGQNIIHAAGLPDGYSNAFTNAWIQYDDKSNMLIYGNDVTDNEIYYGGGGDFKPTNGAVMNSTIMPPRNAIWFMLVDNDGVESYVTSNKVILKYKGEERKKFSTPGDKNGNNIQTTKDNVRFAVYSLNDMEMSGLYKIFSGYGAHMYGGKSDGVVNGLSLYHNWGVGHQPSNSPYADSEIPSRVAMPLNGGGPKTDSDGFAWRDANNDTNGWYDKEDNWAGRYFKFDKRTYVSELNFYYALERDQEGANGIGTYLDGKDGLGDEDYNSHHAHKTDDKVGSHWNQPNYTNDGLNYSWFAMVYSGSVGQITLDKIGIDSGKVSWSINEDGTGEDEILAYKVVFYQVNNVTGETIGDEIVVEEKTGINEKIVGPDSNDRPDLTPGWYESKLIFTVRTEDPDTHKIVEKEKTIISNRIIIFEMAAAGIKAEQRVTDADNGLKIYHPVIDVTPDASASISALDKEVKIETVYASITVDNISTSTVTRIVDINGNELYTSAGTSAPRMWVEYDRTNGKATVHYPAGFFTSRTVMPEMRFAVRNAAIGERTNVVMTISAEKAPDATSDDYTNVYMPAGKLYGKLEPQAVYSDVNSEVEFNALAVSNQDDLPATEAKDGYARIRYVDTNGNLCYIGTMGATEVLAQITYKRNDATEKVLFGGEKLDMRLNPDDQNAVYTSKRLKIAGIPYETEEATDRAGETIKVRKDQKAEFSVQLTYSIEGNGTYNAPASSTTLTYNAEELTSPRKGLADLKTKDDLRGETSADGKTVATDVTAISESFIENYGGLITNIEDAHVALQAVPKHEKLIGYDSFDKWYMDHGDKYDDLNKLNPHSPAHRRAIGHTDLTGTTTFAVPEEVHPLLREDGAPVKVASDFQNTTTVNNAWWNSAASVAPVFHKNDHIKGDFVRDSKGNITGWTSESKFQKPVDHRAYWAGVMAGNNRAYKENVWNNGIIERENGVSVDIRDPKHGYYDMASHFASVTDESGAEKEVRSAYHLGEMPLNANDVMALYGNSEDPHGVASYLGEYSALRSVVLPIHDQMSEEIAKAKFTDCKASVTIDGVTYKLDYPEDEPWNYGNTWKTRAELAFNSSNAAGLNGKSPAEAIFAKANNHMVFKVNHVNHESWFVPNGIPQGAPKTYSLWEAFKGTRFGSVAFNDLTTDKQKDDYIMSVIRMNLDDYCPLAYDVRYTYPFLTTEHVTAENYNNAKTRAAATEDFNRINNMLAAVTPEEVTPVAARDTGRVPFFSNMTTSPEDVVPTAISDVRDDIRGNGFSIVYNRAAGTVTITADGDRELKDAAVYDATGASLVSGTSADRISDQIIVLDVRNISRGAYVISTNLGGAKFMK